MHGKERAEEEMDRITQLPPKIKSGRKKKAVHEPNSENLQKKKANFYHSIPESFSTMNINFSRNRDGIIARSLSY